MLFIKSIGSQVFDTTNTYKKVHVFEIFKNCQNIEKNQNVNNSKLEQFKKNQKLQKHLNLNKKVIIIKNFYFVNP